MTSFVRTTSTRKLGLADTKSIDPLLVSLLSLCTPHGYEEHIVRTIKDLPFIKDNVTTRMHDKEMKNQIFIVGDSSTVFSCHMDIVGEVSKNNIDVGKVDKIFLMEELENDGTVCLKNKGIIWGAKRFDPPPELDNPPEYVGCPLGADDKFGVYILLKMIEAKIPGMYIFHTGEECGGLGSRSLAEKHPGLFKNKERAIAFDRAGYGDVISFQRGSRCCSTEFGDALANELNKGMPPKQLFKSEARGTFTDTASYTKLIPECTNISVGYWDQHGAGEHCDVFWLQTHLLPAILKVNFEKLPSKRDPSKTEYQYSSNVTHYPYEYSNSNGEWVSNVKKKPWKEATPTTPYLEFPVWEPKLGFIEEADPKVLHTSIGRYISNLAYGAKRDSFVDWIISTMEHETLLLEEIASLRAALAIATGQEVIISVTAKPKEEDKLILLAEVISVAASTDMVLYGVYKGWMTDYLNKGKKFITRNRNKTEFSKVEQTVYNKILFALATLIDCSEIHPPATEALLDRVEKYIVAHGEEEGLEVPTKLITSRLLSEANVETTVEEEAIAEQLTYIH